MTPRPSKLTAHERWIRAELATGKSKADIARALRVPANTLKSFVNTLDDVEVILPSVPDPQPIDEGPTREEMLADENTRLKAALRKDRKHDVSQERVLLAIEEALGGLTLPHVDLLDVPTPSSVAKHRQAVVLSDWHGGEVVDPAQVGGLNEFNWEVLERRVNDTAKALLSFKAVRPELLGLDLWILGDMVSGDIHEELTATNQFPIAEQAVECGKLLARFVAQIAPHYPELHISCVSGNHARTKKPHASKNVFDSWDWTAYQLAAGLTSGLSNVTWDIPRAGTMVRRIAGMNFLLWHGDGVRSSMPGVPAGGVTRRTNELRKQYAERGIHLDGFACGHFHSANMWAGNVFINGSLIGTNEFGLKNFGGGEAPKQLLLTFNEAKSRITDVSFITPR